MESNETKLSKYEQARMTVARVVNDNMHTRKWHFYLEYLILFLIFLSTLEIFLSTFEKVTDKHEKLLHFLDLFTTIAFTIEVTLRLWTIGLADKRFKGLKGKLKYMCTTFGFIDVISTYPFWLHFFIPIPYNTLKVVRVVRLLRVFRYIKSFRILIKALKSKKSEMIISMQFLFIVSIILSFFFYFYEHDAQPDKFQDIFDALNWIFCKYLGDPAKAADFEVLTIQAKVVSYLIGLLAIAMVAIPAGLLGSAFLEVIEDEEKKDKIKTDTQTVKYAFKQKQCRYTKFIRVPPYVSVLDLQAEHNLDMPEVMDVIEANPKLFRLRNLAKTRSIEEKPEDRLVVETFQSNRPYGCFIDRGSKITIISPCSSSEAAIGNFSYYLAKIGGFNYVSKEVDMNPHYPKSYYNIKDRNADENLKLFLSDISKLKKGPDCWYIVLISSCGGEEPLYPTQFHYVCCCKKGDENIEGPTCSVIDRDKFRHLYSVLDKEFLENFKLESDVQRFHNVPTPDINISRVIGGGDTCNSFTIRINWSVSCWDIRQVAVAKTFADTFNQILERDVQKVYSKELTKRVTGQDYGYDFYKE